MSIDYGMGQTNIDHATGIRYGVISQNSILQAWADSSEPDYGEPHCPKCGNEARDVVGAQGVSFEDYETYEHECGDYACEQCELLFGGESAFGAMPMGWTFDEDGYVAQDCLDTDVIVIKSPFFTYAPFCSPCVPGAGNLDDAAKFGAVYEAELHEMARDIGTQLGVQTYCFGHDWFDPPVAPYPVYGVVSGRLCFPDSWYGR